MLARVLLVTMAAVEDITTVQSQRVQGVIWGDFCHYLHTDDTSGQYRHHHLALVAHELWIANQCSQTVRSSVARSPGLKGITLLILRRVP
ncbi:hypothetical protein ACHAXM_009441 [Skeletonema potamos]